MITLTDKGAEKVREFLAAQSGGGRDRRAAGRRSRRRCSGFQYALAFDEQRDGDTVFEDKGIRLLVDRPSLPYVKGSVIDFVDGLQGAGFKVENPNVIAACGCGSSFRGRGRGRSLRGLAVPGRLVGISGHGAVSVLSTRRPSRDDRL